MKFKQANDYALLQTELMYSDAHKLVIALINRYVALERSTTAETALAEFVFDDIEPQALVVLSVCVMNGRKSPFQSFIGMISSALLHKNLDSGKVIATNLCVAEFIMASPEIFIKEIAFFGGVKYSCTLFNEESSKKLFQLPSFDKPTKRHKNLGKFQWECTQTTAVDKLNAVALVMLDIPEDNIPPEGTEDRVKYNIRASMRPYLAEKETSMFFDWNQDYRGRMYSSGYHIAPQGNSYEKNILAFKNAPTLTRNDYQEAEYEIQLAIAVAFGQDKVIDSKKIEWFAENEDKLDWTTAKEPTYARAQIMSLDKLRATNRTNIPVELDELAS